MGSTLRRAILASSILAVGWILLTMGLGSFLIEQAYEGRSVGALNRAFAARREFVTLDMYVTKMRLLGLGGAFAMLVAGAALGAALEDARRGSPWARRIVPPASATSLAGVRIWICTVALVSVLCEDVGSAAHLPESLPVATGLGVFALLRHAPGADALLASHAALTSLQLATIGGLVLGQLGLFTRLALPLAFVGGIVMGGVLRLHTHFFHTGLLPLYVIGVLMLTPCADAWSLDAWRRRRAGQAVVEPETPAMEYGWGRFTCWLVIALTYFAAATSKLRHGGFGWWDGVNLKNKVLTDALAVHGWDLPFVPLMAALPLVVFSVMGIVSLVVEFAFIAVPFSVLARRFLPLGAVGLHVGIFISQEIVFLDLLLIHLLFYDNRRWALPLAERVRSRLAAFVPSLSAAPPAASHAPSGAGKLGRFAPALLLGTVLYAATIAVAAESYPITTWPMYSDRTQSTSVDYIVFHGLDRRGEKVALKLERELGVFRFERAYDVIPYGFNPKLEGELRKVLDVFAGLYNRDRAPEAHVVAFRFDLMRWDFANAHDDPARGSSVQHFVHRVGETVAAQTVTNER